MDEVKLMYEDILAMLYRLGHYEACEALLEIYEESFYAPKDRWRQYPMFLIPSESKYLKSPTIN